MEFGQFLIEMTLMPTPGSVRLADKVVDLEKLHRYRYFPDRTTKNYCRLEKPQGVQKCENHGIWTVFGQNDPDAHSEERWFC